MTDLINTFKKNNYEKDSKNNYVCCGIILSYGRLLQSLPISSFGHGSVTISGSTLQAGMYVYSLVVDGQMVDTKRMILTK